VFNSILDPFLWTSAPLTFSLVHLPPSPLPCVNKYVGMYHGRRNFKDTNPFFNLHWSFCLGWWSNLVGPESGQKQSVKFLQNMVNSTIHPPPPQTHIVCIYCTFSLERGGGKVSRGATAHKYSSFIHGGNRSQAGSKIQTNEWMYLQSIKSVITMPQIPLTGQF
jgi:hypothetical protein